MGVDQEVWFAMVSPGFDGDVGFILVEVTVAIRGLVRSFLTQTDNPTVSGLSLAVDERSDSLWLTYEDRALVLRRQNILDNTRYWEQYDYIDSWDLLAEDSYYGLRVMQSDGQIDELERDSSSDFAYIEGTNRDAGTAISEMYWTSKKFVEIRRTVKDIRLERANLADQIEIDVITDRQTTPVSILANTKYAVLSYKTQGENVQFKITLTESDSAIELLTAREFFPTSRRKQE